jgi:hypothetical protein
VRNWVDIRLEGAICDLLPGWADTILHLVNDSNRKKTTKAPGTAYDVVRRRLLKAGVDTSRRASALRREALKRRQMRQQETPDRCLPSCPACRGDAPDCVDHGCIYA